MKAASYYARTEKGAAEVAQRSQAIPARARSLLLMIDGKSTGAQLIEMLAAFPNSGELLQLLETEGYIGPLDGTASGVAPPPAPAPGATGAVPAPPQAAHRRLPIGPAGLVVHRMGRHDQRPHRREPKGSRRNRGSSRRAAADTVVLA